MSRSVFGRLVRSEMEARENVRRAVQEREDALVHG